MAKLPEDWRNRAESPEDVLARIQNGHRAFVQGAAATPTPLVEALSRRRDLEGVELYHLHLEGPVPFAAADAPPGIRSNSLFTGPALRGAVAEGRADFIPVFLSDIPELFCQGPIPLDAAIVQLSPPDAQGHCTLGTSVDCTRAAVDSASMVLAEINAQMPRTHGHTAIHLSEVTAFTLTDRPLHEMAPLKHTEVDAQIGEHVADLVHDGATLQMGIGAIPDAVLGRLGNKHDLGVHSEMFSDGLIPLIEGGVVTNRKKAIYPGLTVTTFVAGTRKLFDFVNDNLTIAFLPCDKTNDTGAIRKNRDVIAINAALEIDLSGQVCADSIGTRIYSGIGGQMDFIRGAAISPGGKPIIALPSTAARGSLSRIVPTLKQGAGVVTTRGHVQYVVTEYGTVNLHGLNLKQRAEALISIAHPQFRAELSREIRAIRHFDIRPNP